MKKWIVLGAYLWVTGLSQLLWLNFAPLITMIEQKYSVTEGTASLLILVFPLIYVPLSIPSGILIDKKGYKWTVAMGSWCMAGFSIFRIFDESFTMLLIGQIGIAVAQPFIVNGVTKLVMDWFPPKEVALATGLGTVGMFVGMILGMAATPFMVSLLGLKMTMIIFAVITVLGALVFQIFVQPNKTHNHDLPPASFTIGFKSLIANKNLVVIFILAFLGLGYFNGFTTWLELILKPNGLDSEQAGIIGGVLILGGIVGAALIPAIAQKLKRKKLFLSLSIFFALITLYPLCVSRDYSKAILFAGLQGFFFLPAFALLLEMAAELAGEVLAGSATGILMLAGNAGGVVVILAMEGVKGAGDSFMPAVYLLIVILASALALSTRIVNNQS
jgi:predicted MFS family arabinose efflux permease